LALKEIADIKHITTVLHPLVLYTSRAVDDGALVRRSKKSEVPLEVIMPAPISRNQEVLEVFTPETGLVLNPLFSL
jgi:hypothetical protein